VSVGFVFIYLALLASCSVLGHCNSRGWSHPELLMEGGSINAAQADEVEKKYGVRPCTREPRKRQMREERLPKHVKVLHLSGFDGPKMEAYILILR